MLQARNLKVKVVKTMKMMRAVRISAMSLASARLDADVVGVLSSLTLQNSDHLWFMALNRSLNPKQKS